MVKDLQVGSSLFKNVVRTTHFTGETRPGTSTVDMLLDKNQYYVRHRSTRTEMYAGRVACCFLVSHVEHAPRALLMLENRLRALLSVEKRWDRRTD